MASNFFLSRSLQRNIFYASYVLSLGRLGYLEILGRGVLTLPRPSLLLSSGGAYAAYPSPTMSFQFHERTSRKPETPQPANTVARAWFCCRLILYSSLVGVADRYRIWLPAYSSNVQDAATWALAAPLTLATSVTHPKGVSRLISYLHRSRQPFSRVPGSSAVYHLPLRPLAWRQTPAEPIAGLQGNNFRVQPHRT